MGIPAWFDCDNCFARFNVALAHCPKCQAPNPYADLQQDEVLQPKFKRKAISHEIIDGAIILIIGISILTITAFIMTS